jgi:tetratricopeptide (TPR) repeat protein
VAERVREAHAAVEGAPHRAVAWGNYGMMLDAHRFTAPAVEAYERAHDLDPRDFRWPYFLAAILDLSLPQRAVGWYEIALELDPGYAPARIRFAETLEKLGRVAEARRQFARAADLEPRNPYAPFGLGRTALAEGAVDEAVRQLERAAELAPRLQAVVVTLARAYQRAGRGEEAAATAARARGLPRMAHHPDELRAEVGRLAVDRESYLRRARTHLDVSRPDEALAQVREVLAEDPEDAEALLLLAEAQDRRGETAAALAAAEEALQLGSEVPGAGSLVASLLFKAERFAEAEDQAEDVLARRPDVHMLLLLAMTAARRGDAGDMLRRLDAAIELGTDDPQLSRLLGGLLADVAASYAELGRFAEATHRLEQAVAVLEASGAAAEELERMRAQLARYRAEL